RIAAQHQHVQLVDIDEGALLAAALERLEEFLAAARLALAGRNPARVHLQGVFGTEYEIAGGDVADIVPTARGLVRQHGGGVVRVFRFDRIYVEGNQHGDGS